MYSSTPNNRADPNKRAGRKFQSLLLNAKAQMDIFCCSEYWIESKNMKSIKKCWKTSRLIIFLKKLVSFLTEKS